MTRRWLIGIPVALVAAFALGRYTAHPAVVSKDVVKTEVVYKDRIVEKVVHDVQVQHDVKLQQHVVTQWRTGPDKITTVTQYVDREKQAETKTAARTDSTRDQQTEAHQVTLETHTVEARPDWNLSVLAGAQLGGRSLLVPAPFVGGVIVHRRVLGPFSIGAWGTTGMAGGISIGASW